MVTAMREPKGFTLVELIIVLAIASILLTVGVPSFSNVINNNRITAEVNRFTASVQLARSEAVKQSRIITICRSGDGFNCGGGGAADTIYEKGWLIYMDPTANDNFNSGTDTLIQIGDAAAEGVTIRSDSDGNNWLSFRPNGLLSESGFAEYAFCNNGVSTAAVPGRLVRIDLTGRPGVTQLAPGAPCTPA